MAKIIINKDYFKNLSKGTHTLKVKFKDGYTEGSFEVDNKITFTIMGESFTATAGQTWGEWILSFNSGVSGNGILWVSPTANGLFLDTRVQNTWGQGLALGAEEDALYDSNDIRQTLNTTIVNGASYGRSSDAPT